MHICERLISEGWRRIVSKNCDKIDPARFFLMKHLGTQRGCIKGNKGSHSNCGSLVKGCDTIIVVVQQCAVTYPGSNCTEARRTPPLNMTRTLGLAPLGVERTTINRRGKFCYHMNLLCNTKGKRGTILEDWNHLVVSLQAPWSLSSDSLFSSLI